MLRQVARKTLLALPLLFIAAFFLVPLGLSVAISFWERVGLRVRPAFTLRSYAEFLSGVRFAVLERSLLVAVEVTLTGAGEIGSSCTSVARSLACGRGQLLERVC